MTPEILAKIMGIVGKTGERVIVVDPASGIPVVLLNLDEYEKLRPAPAANPIQPPVSSPVPNLTASKPFGSIEPDLAVWQEAQKSARGDWGGDEDKEEDRYYMEPTE